MNKIDEQAALNEKKGREIFKTFADQYNLSVEFTSEQYDTIDLYMNITAKGKTYRCCGEIKNRELNAIKYKTHFMTIHKLKALYNKHLDKPLFVNIIGNDMFLYNVKNLLELYKQGKVYKVRKNLPNYNVPNAPRHWQECLEFDRCYGLHLQKVNNKWKIIKNE